MSSSFPFPAVSSPSTSERAPGASEGKASSTGRSVAAVFGAVVDSVRDVVYADPRTIRLAVGCLMANGHLLVEDFPGLGKTTLAKALARSLGIGFRRIQFTADLLPSDITGAMVLETGRGEPTFRPGPIFTNVVMADELNRASPRAQSALLEAMEERQVTVDGTTMALPRPFLVIATQNPHDAAGTSPLPHGQRDRFLLRLSVGYPDRDAENALLAGVDPSDTVRAMAPAITEQELSIILQAVASVHVAPAARSYLLDLVAATRSHQSVRVGASPRASMSVLGAARAMAVAAGRSYVIPEDIQMVAVPALCHRLLLYEASGPSERAAEAVVEEILHVVPVPVAEPVVQHPETPLPPPIPPPR
ncbi:MAG: AAA family ATPase [Actinobacteria bacterium]|nr:AAA family ATPase [Actinomycetota bacterium]MCL5444786.1 AAA family ATPase [Actinomycetota bacterium]